MKLKTLHLLALSLALVGTSVRAASEADLLGTPLPVCSQGAQRELTAAFAGPAAECKSLIAASDGECTASCGDALSKKNNFSAAAVHCLAMLNLAAKGAPADLASALEAVAPDLSPDIRTMAVKAETLATACAPPESPEGSRAQQHVDGTPSPTATARTKPKRKRTKVIKHLPRPHAPFEAEVIDTVVEEEVEEPIDAAFDAPLPLRTPTPTLTPLHGDHSHDAVPGHVGDSTSAQEVQAKAQRLEAESKKLAAAIDTIKKQEDAISPKKKPTAAGAADDTSEIDLKWKQWDAENKLAEEAKRLHIPSFTPTISQSSSPSVHSSPSHTSSPSGTAEPTETRSPSGTASETKTPTPSYSESKTPTISHSATATHSVNASPSHTATLTASHTVARSASHTHPAVKAKAGAGKHAAAAGKKNTKPVSPVDSLLGGGSPAPSTSAIPPSHSPTATLSHGASPSVTATASFGSSPSSLPASVSASTIPESRIEVTHAPGSKSEPDAGSKVADLASKADGKLLATPPSPAPSAPAALSAADGTSLPDGMTESQAAWLLLRDTEEDARDLLQEAKLAEQTAKKELRTLLGKENDKALHSHLQKLLKDASPQDKALYKKANGEIKTLRTLVKRAGLRLHHSAQGWSKQLQHLATVMRRQVIMSTAKHAQQKGTTLKEVLRVLGALPQGASRTEGGVPPPVAEVLTWLDSGGATELESLRARIEMIRQDRTKEYQRAAAVAFDKWKKDHKDGGEEDDGGSMDFSVARDHKDDPSHKKREADAAKAEEAEMLAALGDGPVKTTPPKAAAPSSEGGATAFASETDYESSRASLKQILRLLKKRVSVHEKSLTQLHATEKKVVAAKQKAKEARAKMLAKAKKDAMLALGKHPGGHGGSSSHHADGDEHHSSEEHHDGEEHHGDGHHGEVSSHEGGHHDGHHSLDGHHAGSGRHSGGSHGRGNSTLAHGSKSRRDRERRRRDRRRRRGRRHGSGGSHPGGSHGHHGNSTSALGHHDGSGRHDGSGHHDGGHHGKGGNGAHSKHHSAAGKPGKRQKEAPDREVEDLRKKYLTKRLSEMPPEEKVKKMSDDEREQLDRKAKRYKKWTVSRLRTLAKLKKTLAAETTKLIAALEKASSEGSPTGGKPPAVSPETKIMRRYNVTRTRILKAISTIRTVMKNSADEREKAVKLVDKHIEELEHPAQAPPHDDHSKANATAPHRRKHRKRKHRRGQRHGHGNSTNVHHNDGSSHHGNGTLAGHHPASNRTRLHANSSALNDHDGRQQKHHDEDDHHGHHAQRSASAPRHLRGETGSGSSHQSGHHSGRNEHRNGRRQRRYGRRRWRRWHRNGHRFRGSALEAADEGSIEAEMQQGEREAEREHQEEHQELDQDELLKVQLEEMGASEE